MEKGMARKVWLRMAKALNVVLVTVPFIVVWQCFYSYCTAVPYYYKGYLMVFALFAILYFTFGRVYDAFLVSIARISEIIYSQMLAQLATNGMMYLVIVLLAKKFPNPMPLLLSVLFEVAISAVWALAVHKIYFWMVPPRRTLIIYDQMDAMDSVIRHYGMDIKFNIVGKLDISCPMETILAAVQDVDTVFICGVHSHERNIIIKFCLQKNIRVYMNPRLGDVLMSSAKHVHMCNLPLLLLDRYPATPEYLLIKRLFDVLASLLGVVLASPFMLITALCIKAYDRGPVLYKQCRLTQDGKRFWMYKFRSMRVDAEKDGVARLAGENDSRITPVGSVIRKVRLDELPQLFNILKGEMSFVGPRPERPEIASQYEKELPEFALRLQAKAGLTGLAQVYGKYNSTPYDKLQMDLMYIAKPSLTEDMRIILATIKILFEPASTEGIAEGQLTAEDTAETTQSR